MALLGNRNLLNVSREAEAGLYLDAGPLGEILLPRRYVVPGWNFKDQIDVFLYRDSEDRLVATTESPLAMVGGFACMEVRDISENAGAFLDWGLSKDLLLPFREQGSPVRLGQRVVVAVLMDDRTNRIIASARVDKHFSTDVPAYREGQEVSALVFAKTPLGFNVIVENKHRGLLYHDGAAHTIKYGQQLKCFVRTVREDRKVDLGLDAAGYQRVGPLTEQILEMLSRTDGQLNMDDESTPDSIRLRFSVSKKAFKQALGRLLHERKIEFTKPGIRLVNK